jgi:hypothetical protein
LNGFDIFTPNIPLHNRVPSKQLYYWGPESLMGYPLEQIMSGYVLN